MAQCPACHSEVEAGSEFCPECLSRLPSADIASDEEIVEQLSESQVTGKPTGFYGAVQCPDHPGELPRGKCSTCGRWLCQICMPDIQRLHPDTLVCEACIQQSTEGQLPNLRKRVVAELVITFTGIGLLAAALFTLISLTRSDLQVPLDSMGGLVFGGTLVGLAAVLSITRRPLVGWVGLAAEVGVLGGMAIAIAGLLASAGEARHGPWALLVALAVSVLPVLFTLSRVLQLSALGGRSSARSNGED